MKSPARIRSGAATAKSENSDSSRPAPASQVSPRLQAAISIVRKQLRFHGCLRLPRDRMERDFWAEIGLTLAQRDQAADALVAAGEARYEPAHTLCLVATPK